MNFSLTVGFNTFSIHPQCLSNTATPLEFTACAFQVSNVSMNIIDSDVSASCNIYPSLEPFNSPTYRAMGSIDTSTLLAAQSTTNPITKASKHLVKSFGVDRANLQSNAVEKTTEEADESDTDAEPDHQDGTAKKLEPSQRKRQQRAVFDAW